MSALDILIPYGLGALAGAVLFLPFGLWLEYRRRARAASLEPMNGGEPWGM